MAPLPSLYIPEVVSNEHLDKITAYFGSLENRPADISPDLRFIFICFTNRCGSNYLAEILSSDGKLPEAGENLNFDTVIEHAQRRNLRSFHDYISFLVRQTARNGLVMVKAASTHIELLARAGILDQIISRSRFVVIERGDKLGQAISHGIAFQTGKFMSTTPDAVAARTLSFNADELTTIIEDICESYKQFSLFFSRNGIVPAYVYYEHLVADTESVIKYLGQYLDISDLTINGAKLTLEKQANSTNDDWREQYLRQSLLALA
ncbi:MAG: Stf0 family sulfotransferase [Acidocella sp.]|nr:Stf0 family sulfotransferase [Acidocella sp.]